MADKNLGLVLCEEIEIRDTDIKEAIEIRFSECFQAMAFLRTLNGGPERSIAWKLMYEYKATEIVQEAQLRGLPIETYKAAVDTQKRLVIDTPLYDECMRIMSST